MNRQNDTVSLMDTNNKRHRFYGKVGMVCGNHHHKNKSAMFLEYVPDMGYKFELINTGGITFLKSLDNIIWYV